MNVNILRAVSTVSLMILTSRVTGLIRDMMIAAAFGASAKTDAFNVAFRIPNLLRRLFAEGAFSQAFVPLLAVIRSRDGDQAARGLLDAVSPVLLWVLVIASAVGVVGAPVLVWLIGAGLHKSGVFDDAVVMTRWMFPYIGLVSLVALSAGILNTWGRFVVPAATPVLLNVAIIAAAVWGVPLFRDLQIEPIYALAAGVMLGGCLQLIVQVPALAKAGLMPRLVLRPRRLLAAWRHEGVRKILANMGPSVVAVSAAPISLMINTQIATQLAPGSVSWLNYADRLMEFPTALLGVALGVVLTPQLSAAHAGGDPAKYSALLDWGLRLVLLLALPCAVALLVFAVPLVSVLFHRGAFGAEDVRQTAAAVMGWGVGLLGIVAIKILAPGYFARQDIRTPVRIGLVVLVATQLFNLIFVPLFGVAGLALSIGLGAWLNAIALLAGLLRRGNYRPSPGWRLFGLRVVGASAAMGGGLYWVAWRFDWIALGSNELLRVSGMTLVLASAAVIYLGVLAACGLRARHLNR